MRFIKLAKHNINSTELVSRNVILVVWIVSILFFVLIIALSAFVVKVQLKTLSNILDSKTTATKNDQEEKRQLQKMQKILSAFEDKHKKDFKSVNQNYSLSDTSNDSDKIPQDNIE